MIELYEYINENIFQFLGVIFSIIYVTFSIKQNILCWPALIIASLFNMYAYHIINLPLQVSMQFFFIGTGVYGWYNWKQSTNKPDLKVSSWNRKRNYTRILIGLSITILIMVIL